MSKPSRHKETHYNRKEKPAGPRKPAEKRERREGPPARPQRDESGGQSLGRKSSRPSRESSSDRRGPVDREKQQFPGKPGRPAKRFSDRPDDRRERPAHGREDRPAKGPYKKPGSREGDGDRERRPFTRDRQEGGDRPYPRKREADTGQRFRREGDGAEGTGKKRIARKDAPREAGPRDYKGRKPFRQEEDRSKFSGRPGKAARKPEPELEDQDYYEDERPFLKSGKWNEQAKAGPMTLNKYLAHAGVSSRRDAADIVKEGRVKVNGQVVKEPGYRVQAADAVMLDGKVMTPQKHFVYVLLNKPKDFLTTTEDDRGRRTVMELVANAGADRLFPVGRLDRNTTGVLLLTNDGDLAQKLSHPSYEVKKIYQVTLDKDLTKKDFDKVLEGVELEDGPAKVDRLAYLEKKNELGLEIHSGRNRIVRRIFEALGYQVEKLDRVMYAGLTKKNVTRGQWRFLTEKEVIHLKHFRHR